MGCILTQKCCQIYPCHRLQHYVRSMSPVHRWQKRTKGPCRASSSGKCAKQSCALAGLERESRGISRVPAICGNSSRCGDRSPRSRPRLDTEVAIRLLTDFCPRRDSLTHPRTRARCVRDNRVGNPRSGRGRRRANLRAMTRSRAIPAGIAARGCANSNQREREARGSVRDQSKSRTGERSEDRRRHRDGDAGGRKRLPRPRRSRQRIGRFLDDSHVNRDRPSPFASPSSRTSHRCESCTQFAGPARHSASNEATRGTREALRVRDEHALAAAAATSGISEAAPGVTTRPASAP